MKNKTFSWAVRILAIAALAATGAVAQTSDSIPKHMQLRGVINDYTPANSPATVTGPWELRGHWSLTVKSDSGKADFSAALTMERSDQGVLQSGGGDFNNATDRKAHTHHITLVDGDITAIPNNPNGFRVTGPAIITINGAYPPPFGKNSTAVIDITGGTGDNSVAISNIAVTLKGDAVAHFGAAPLNGVVRSVRHSEDH